MKDEYNLTEQELLYKLATENDSYISKNTFEKIKSSMRKVDINVGVYEFSIDTSRNFNNYAAYYVVENSGNGRGHLFCADSTNVCEFIHNGEELYLYNCSYQLKEKEKLNNNAKQILGIILSLIILLCASFALEPLYGKPRILLAGPIALIGIYQIAKWLIPNFTDKISLKKDDYQKALYVSYTIGQNDKELEINVRNKRDKYYEEKRKKDEICAPKAKELSDKFLDIKLKKMDLSNSLTTYLNNIYPFITPIEYFNIKSQIQDLKDIFPEEYYKFIFQYEDLKDIANIPDDQLIFNNKFYLQIENQFVKQNYIPTQYTLTQAIHLLYNIKLRINDNYGLLDKEKSFYTNLDKVTEYSIFSHHTRQSFLSAIDINADFFSTEPYADFPIHLVPYINRDGKKVFLAILTRTDEDLGEINIKKSELLYNNSDHNITAKIIKITGGEPPKTYYGCNIKVTID